MLVSQPAPANKRCRTPSRHSAFVTAKLLYTISGLDSKNVRLVFLKAVHYPMTRVAITIDRAPVGMLTFPSDRLLITKRKLA